MVLRFVVVAQIAQCEGSGGCGRWGVGLEVVRGSVAFDEAVGIGIEGFGIVDAAVVVPDFSLRLPPRVSKFDRLSPQGIFGALSSLLRPQRVLAFAVASRLP